MVGREDMQHHEAAKCPTLVLSSSIPNLNEMSTSTSVTFNISAWGQLPPTGLLKGKAQAFSKGKTRDCGKPMSRQERDDKENLDGIGHIVVP